MESALLEVGTRKQTENDEEQVGCRRAAVGVARLRRCCCGPVGVVSCSGAAVGVAAAVAAAGELFLWWVSQMTAGWGGRVGGCWVKFCLYNHQKTTSFNALKKKKIKFIEPAGSLGTGRFVRFTDWTAGSGGPIPVWSSFGLVTGPNRNRDRSAVQPVGPAGPVRFLKPWLLGALLGSLRPIEGHLAHLGLPWPT